MRRPRGLLVWTIRRMGREVWRLRRAFMTVAGRKVYVFTMERRDGRTCLVRLVDAADFWGTGE